MFITFNFKNYLIFLKRIIFGVLIGASVMVPGLSGGTTALILGEFTKILTATEQLFKNFKKSFVYLFPLSVGGILGVYFSSVIINFFIVDYYIYFSFAVIGIIAGSIPVFLPQKNKVPHVKKILYIFLGAAPVIIGHIMSNKNIFSSENVFVTIFIGMICAVALILPGISLTNILICFGCYQKLIDALSNLDFSYIFIFGSSLLLGIVLTIKMISNAYKYYENEIKLVLLGMVCCSIIDVLTVLPQPSEIIPCVLLLIAGAIISFFVSCFSK